MPGAIDATSRNEHRLRARARVGDLLRLLKAAEESPQVAQAVELAQHLERAIDAFHMEAIRFRMFTLERLLTTGATPASAEIGQVVADIKAALDAAGFHTRSVAN